MQARRIWKGMPWDDRCFVRAGEPEFNRMWKGWCWCGFRALILSWWQGVVIVRGWACWVEGAVGGFSVGGRVVQDGGGYNL